jgi:hypothetical protein
MQATKPLPVHVNVLVHVLVHVCYIELVPVRNLSPCSQSQNAVKP